jgi:hypothetical protein
MQHEKLTISSLNKPYQPFIIFFDFFCFKSQDDHGVQNTVAPL